MVPCGGDPVLRARLLGALEEPPPGNVVRVTRNTQPTLVGYLPTGWTLPTFSISNGTDTFGPYVPDSIIATEWRFAVPVNLPVGEYTIVGTPALDGDSNAQPVLGSLTILAGVGILAGPTFGILGGPTFGILVRENQ